MDPEKSYPLPHHPYEYSALTILNQGQGFHPEHVFYISGIIYFLYPGDCIKKIAIIFVIALLVLPLGVSALVTYAGNQVSINEPVNDDLFISGNIIEVNAPVQSIVAAGGTITLNAPVRGDVIAAGGMVTVNGDVGGKVVAIGGSIDLAGNVSTNVLLQGGTVTIRKPVTIGKDAMISAGTVHNAGTVTGTLSVQSQSVENTGSAGKYEVKPEQPPGTLPVWLLSLGMFLVTCGWFIIGLLLITIMPSRFLQVESEVRTNAVVTCLIGIAGIILAVIILVLLAITIVFLPLSLVLGSITLISLLLAGLFVASAMGRVIGGYLNWRGKEWQFYTLGFLVLCILYLIPIVNIITFVISTGLGFGAILYTLQKNWGGITGSAPS